MSLMKRAPACSSLTFVSLLGPHFTLHLSFSKATLQSHFGNKKYLIRLMNFYRLSQGLGLLSPGDQRTTAFFITRCLGMQSWGLLWVVLTPQPALGSSTCGPPVGRGYLAETTRAVSWITEIKMQMKSCASQAGPLGSCLSVRGCCLTVPWENVSRFLDLQVVRKSRPSNQCLLFSGIAIHDHFLKSLVWWLIGRHEEWLLVFQGCVLSTESNIHM